MVVATKDSGAMKAPRNYKTINLDNARSCHTWLRIP